MIKSLIVIVILLGGGFYLSAAHIGYSYAGKYYKKQQRKYRRSVRSGTRYYYLGRFGRTGTGGIRPGK